MIIILYFGIPLAIILVADIRSLKGKRSVIMLTVMLAAQIVFNFVATINSFYENNRDMLNIGISLTVGQIAAYITALYITSKTANKVKRNLELGYTYRLQELRSKYMMSQQQIAQKIGLKKRLYSRYELGQEDIPVHTILKLAKLYGVSTDYLLGMETQEVQKTAPGSEQK